MISGAEVNITDYDGHLDFSDKELKLLDWVTASIHAQVIKPSTVDDITKAYINLATKKSLCRCDWTLCFA